MPVHATSQGTALATLYPTAEDGAKNYCMLSPVCTTDAPHNLTHPPFQLLSSKEKKINPSCENHHLKTIVFTHNFLVSVKKKHKCSFFFHPQVKRGKDSLP